MLETLKYVLNLWQSVESSLIILGAAKDEVIFQTRKTVFDHISKHPRCVLIF